MLKSYPSANIASLDARLGEVTGGRQEGGAVSEWEYADLTE
jgi:hypothetical protein